MQRESKPGGNRSACDPFLGNTEKVRIVSTAVHNHYQKRLCMRKFLNFTLLSACVALMASGILLTFPAGPDYWVKFDANGNDVPEVTVPGGKLRRVVLVVGNSGTPGQKDLLVWITALTGDGSSSVCDVLETIKPPVAGNPVAPLSFQVFYPEEKTKREDKNQPEVSKPVKYKLVGSVAEPNTGRRYEDQNKSNNRVEVTITVPPGGTPSCIKLHSFPVPRDFVGK